MNEQRFKELDGLRGIAVLMVLLDHFFEASKSTSKQEDLLRTLIHPFANGGPAVVLFFLLSGFVLSLRWWEKAPVASMGFIESWKRSFPVLFSRRCRHCGRKVLSDQKYCSSECAETDVESQSY